MSITVITTTFNAENKIRNLISSLNNQTDKDFVWVVVDGKSKDATVDIIKRDFCG